MDDLRGRHLAPFGAIILMLSGAFNVLDGVVAIVNPGYFEHPHLLFADVSAWGWWFAVYGAVELLVGFAVLKGSEIALWPAVVLAAVNAMSQLAFVAHYPAWSLSIIALDVLAMYGFAAQGLATGVEHVEADGDRDRRPSTADDVAVTGPRGT
jgi:hypothetical protein